MESVTEKRRPIFFISLSPILSPLFLRSSMKDIATNRDHRSSLAINNNHHIVSVATDEWYFKQN